MPIGMLSSTARSIITKKTSTVTITGPVIPNMTSATLYASGEPGTFSLTVSGQSNSLFNGIYYMTGSHFYGGDTSYYPMICNGIKYSL